MFDLNRYKLENAMAAGGLTYKDLERKGAISAADSKDLQNGRDVQFRDFAPLVKMAEILGVRVSYLVGEIAGA